MAGVISFEERVLHVALATGFKPDAVYKILKIDFEMRLELGLPMELRPVRQPYQKRQRKEYRASDKPRP